jgi:hypothetical protein
MTAKPPATQCNKNVERRVPGRRYVSDRWQCKRQTRHISGYCQDHRLHWTVKQEAQQ